MLGRNDGSPSIHVLLDSARSAEPPHSSGSVAAIAFSVRPEALRVETALPAGNSGSLSVQPSGSLRARMRSSSAARAGCASRQAA